MPMGHGKNSQFPSAEFVQKNNTQNEKINLKMRISQIELEKYQKKEISIVNMHKQKMRKLSKKQISGNENDEIADKSCILRIF